VIVWLPRERLSMANPAIPFERVCNPIVVVPSRSVTVPVGVPVAGVTGDTVALKEID
jgi:hypothetical protein